MIAVALLLAGVGHRAGAQQLLSPVLEARIESTLGNVTTVQGGVGVQVRPGTYLRFAGIAAYGTAWRDDSTGGSARIEAQARFHLDPLRESALGLYGVGGLAATWDEFRDWQPRLVVGIGCEIGSSGARTWAVEAALAGGVRVTAILRGVRYSRR